MFDLNQIPKSSRLGLKSTFQAVHTGQSKFLNWILLCSVRLTLLAYMVGCCSTEEHRGIQRSVECVTSYHCNSFFYFIAFKLNQCNFHVPLPLGPSLGKTLKPRDAVAVAAAPVSVNERLLESALKRHKVKGYMSAVHLKSLLYRTPQHQNNSRLIF